MKQKTIILFMLFFITGFIFSCADNQSNRLKPTFITQKVKHDTDDPAIWIHPEDPSKSFILGTDKDHDGALYVFDLKGNIIEDKVIRDLGYPNNVDVEYSVRLNGQHYDIAVLTERDENQLRIFRLPDMKPLDHGGISVFVNDSLRSPMGIALYKRPSDENVFAFVSRKTGRQDGKYVHQYLIYEGDKGSLKGQLVREFGQWEGEQDIEAIAVDDELGYVYYSDESYGVRKYYADPDSPNVELGSFAKEGFKEDREGISIYKTTKGTGYILVSDQAAGQFHIFPREGTQDNPHNHPLISVLSLSTRESDGSEVTSVSLNSDFPNGLFAAMSTNRTFQLYDWNDMAAVDSLKVRK